jgi:hypothetical protein
VNTLLFLVLNRNRYLDFARARRHCLAGRGKVGIKMVISTANQGDGRFPGPTE